MHVCILAFWYARYACIRFSMDALLYILTHPLCTCMHAALRSLRIANCLFRENRAQQASFQRSCLTGTLHNASNSLDDAHRILRPRPLCTVAGHAPRAGPAMLAVRMPESTCHAQKAISKSPLVASVTQSQFLKPAGSLFKAKLALKKLRLTTCITSLGPQGNRIYLPERPQYVAKKEPKMAKSNLKSRRE